MVDENLELRLRSAFTISKLLESGASGIGGMTEEEMRTIKAPTLVVWGKYDELVGPPERTGERLLRDISGSRLVVIDNAGHGAGQPGIQHAVISALDRFATA